MLVAAPIRGAAPESKVGYLVPTVVGRSVPVGGNLSEVPAELMDERVVVDQPIPGVVDIVSPSIGQFVVGLDGTELDVAGETVTLADTGALAPTGRTAAGHWSGDGRHQGRAAVP